MEDFEKYFLDSHKMTHFARALADGVKASDSMLLTDYRIFQFACQIYRKKQVKYLRGDFPTLDLYKRARNMIREAGIVTTDNDYLRLWRVTFKDTRYADDVVCEADPYCYISHLSAMQRYGVTLRRPKSLYLTRPNNVLGKKLLEEKSIKDLSIFIFNGIKIETPKLYHVQHPKKVRGRNVKVKKVSQLGEMRTIRGSNVRVSSIGQVFFDTLVDPQYCGGMRHVLDVWRDHASTYINEIILKIDQEDNRIAKVRAGYILDELLCVDNTVVQGWRKFAQRGGSRLLDPSKPYKNKYSEKWMISLNV